MSKNENKPATPAGYRPSGRTCAQCQHAARDCSALDFAAMRPAGKPDADGVQRVACSGYVRAGRVGGGDELVPADRCGNCHTCAPNGLGGPMRMIVCPDCGNKRCPKGNDHRNACTGSNEPGQPGSAYPAIPTLDECRVIVAPLIDAIKSGWRRPCRCGPDGCSDSGCAGRVANEAR
jgi:hypothetical protein